MNTKVWRKAIHGAYLDYYGENISDECVDRIIDYYRQLTRDNRINAEINKNESLSSL